MTKKNAFMLSSADLMMVKFGSTPVFDLNPNDHGVGLAQEIAINLDSSNLDLTFGVAQAIVDTHRTNVQVNITGSVKEYTAENLLRAQGLDPAGAKVARRGTLTAAANAAAVSLSIASDPIPGEATSALAAQAGTIEAGATLLIQTPDGLVTFPTRASAASTFASGTHTVAIAAPYVIPVGMNFPIGSKVWVITEMAMGDTGSTELFSVKISGTLSNFNKPVVAVFPKVSVTKGFNLVFTETEYGSMPWELRPALLTQSEVTGRLTEIGTTAPGRVYVA